MPAVTIRNLSEETSNALKMRAKKNGRSTEAEIRDILEKAAKPESRLKIGSELAQFGREIGGVELQFERDQTPTAPASFE